jgi:hypothetical protein
MTNKGTDNGNCNSKSLTGLQTKEQTTATATAESLTGLQTKEQTAATATADP